MLTFLFWNIQKKPLLPRVARLAQTHGADVVVLAECAHTDAELVAALNAVKRVLYRRPKRVNPIFRVASALPRG